MAYCMAPEYKRISFIFYTNFLSNKYRMRKSVLTVISALLIMLVLLCIMRSEGFAGTSISISPTTSSNISTTSTLGPT